MQRRTFLTLSAAAAASAAFPFKARATVPKLYSWDASPPMNDTAAFVRWMQENRGEDPRYLRARGDLRRELPRYRFRRDHHRAARGRAHDKLDRCQDGRESARDRHRFRLSVGLSLEPYRQGVDDRDHQAVGRAHPRRLRRPHP